MCWVSKEGAWHYNHSSSSDSYAVLTPLHCVCERATFLYISIAYNAIDIVAPLGMIIRIVTFLYIV